MKQIEQASKKNKNKKKETNINWRTENPWLCKTDLKLIKIENWTETGLFIFSNKIKELAKLQTIRNNVIWNHWYLTLEKKTQRSVMALLSGKDRK